MKRYTVYLLRHPETNKIIYVGCTANVPQRKANHRHRFNIKLSFRPLFEEVETFNTKYDGLRKEDALIAEYKKKGAKLYNIKDFIEVENQPA